jgi:nucleoside-diphosphate-sugar epimerase
MLPGVESMRGDITDAAFADLAMRGASVVYHCANPARYDAWNAQLPPLARTIREAATRAGARLVVLDNLYMYGAPEGGVIREDSPIAPNSEKGRLRAELAAELDQARERGELHVSVGRASDFFGPRAEHSVTFSPEFFANLESGDSAFALGDPDQPHAYAFIPDVAEGLLLLGTRPTERGQTWILPHAWQGSSRALAQLFGRFAGREAKLWSIGQWQLRLASVFDRELRAVPEMMYQWQSPFTVDDSRFRRAFGMNPTPIEIAVQETLHAYGLDRIARAA